MNTATWQRAPRLLASVLGFLAILWLSACGGGGGGFSFPTGGAGSVTVPPAGLHYDRNAVVYQTGQPIEPNAPSSSGGRILRYTVFPALPDGLQIDPTSGIVSGTPRVPAAPAIYTVRGANFEGSVTARLQISVNARAEPPPSNLSYGNQDAAYTVGQTIPPNHPSLSGGDVSGFAVQPALPDGLVIDPVTGVISGTPTRAAARAGFKVTASNSVGSTSITLQIQVVDLRLPPTSLGYQYSKALYSVGNPISPNYPSSTGGAISLFVASTPLPAGLSIDAVSGVISGTPSSTQAATDFLVTGSNEVGSVTTIVNITVIAGGASILSGSMVSARTNHTATLLPNGRVLVAGGYDDTTTLATAESFDPGVGLWAGVGAMHESRFFHTATLLPDGRVLVAGGEYSGGERASAELFDPATGTWTLTGSMSVARSGHTATLLPNGQVLVAGGFDGASYLATAELYDPASGQWTTTGAMSTARSVFTATPLAGGTVLVAGGFAGTGAIAGAEIYDPAAGRWAATSPMGTARLTHTATLLPNGKVLVAGGFGGGTSLASAELYDPGNGQWTTTGAMSTPRTGDASTLLLDGRVLVAGGYDNNATLGTTERYDPAAGQWTMAGPLKVPRYFHTATLLSDGNVLIAGGADLNSLSSAELSVP
jgi:Galactose oxidase, central domain/Putative Ig domain/Kelch motif